jgi:CubicO group peptidase (beta-lactamase class C family)
MPFRISKATFATCLFLLVGTGASAQQPAAPLADFDAYVRQAVADWEVPGLAIAVVKDDSVVFSRGYGIREKGRPERVTTRTLFANASTTKAFTSAAIAMLVDEDLLAWDDRVEDRLPGTVLADPYVTRELRLRDLLVHNLGFGDPQELWYGMELSFDEIVHRLRFQEPATSFRSRFAYNNVGYAMAGEIGGAANGTSWDELIEGRILAPLGMTATVTQGRYLSDGADVALPHDMVADTLAVIEGEMGLVDPIPAAGSMFSNIEDMSRWIRFLLAGGAWNGAQLISDTAFAELLKPQDVLPPDEFYASMRLTEPWFTGYGMGWFLQDYRGRKLAFHTGSIDGFVAIIGLMPEEELGLVVFANRDHAELRHALMFRVLDLYLGEPVRDWNSEFLALYDSIGAERDRSREQAEATRVLGTTPSLSLAAYAGTYTDSLFGPVEVQYEPGSPEREEHLVLYRSDFLTADLGHWHYDVFEATWRKQWLGPDRVTFVIGADGKPAELRIWNRALQRAAEPDA